MSDLELVQKEIERRSAENVKGITATESNGIIRFESTPLGPPMFPQTDIRVSTIVPTCKCDLGLCSCDDKAAPHCPCCGEIGISEDVL